MVAGPALVLAAIASIWPTVSTGSLTHTWIDVADFMLTAMYVRGVRTSSRKKFATVVDSRRHPAYSTLCQNEGAANMSKSDRMLIEVWMLEIAARMMKLSLRSGR